MKIFLSRRYIMMYLHIIISLGIGSTIYLLWRTTDILIFYLFDLIGIMDSVNSLRASVSHIDVPYFVLYALPDLCWVYSFTIYIGVFSYNEFFRGKQLWFMLLPVVLGVGSEVGQLLNIIPGTFDIWDIVAYSSGFIIAYLFLHYKKFIIK